MNLKSREINLRRNALRQGLFTHVGNDVFGVTSWILTDLDNVVVGGICPWKVYEIAVEDTETYIGDEKHEDIAP